MFSAFTFLGYRSMKRNSANNQIKRQAVRKSRTGTKRVLIKTEGELPGDAKKGFVIAVLGRHIIVRECKTREIYECRVKGTLITANKKSTLTAVGDSVFFTNDKYSAESAKFDKSISESGYKTGIINSVELRRNSLARKIPGKAHSEHIIAANSDLLIVIAACKTPAYNRNLLDRYLVAAESGGIRCAFCINKIDLLNENELQSLKKEFEVYQKQGIETFFISADKEINIEAPEKAARGKRVILSGASGVGKSSLINKLLGSSVQAVQEISEKTSKGRHTTSSVRMFELPDNTEIIDTPGIREFGISGIEKEEIALYFHDFDRYFPECKYPGCTHMHEPGCAVKKAVENGNVDLQRYESYKNLYQSIEDEEEKSGIY